jgi:hypothetical protein
VKGLSLVNRTHGRDDAVNRAEVNTGTAAVARHVGLPGVEDHGMRDIVISWQPGRPCRLFAGICPQSMPNNLTRGGRKRTAGSRIVSYD